MPYYRLHLLNDDTVIVEDNRSANMIAEAIERGPISFSGDAYFEGADGGLRGNLTLPRGAILAIYEPEDESELTMEEAPAVVTVGGTMFKFQDGKLVGTEHIQGPDSAKREDH